MFSEKDFERLCLAKKTLKVCGSSTRPRVNPKEFPYTTSYDWFKKTQKKVVPVEVEGIPEELLQAGNEVKGTTNDKHKCTSPH